MRHTAKDTWLWEEDINQVDSDFVRTTPINYEYPKNPKPSPLPYASFFDGYFFRISIRTYSSFDTGYDTTQTISKGHHITLSSPL